MTEPLDRDDRNGDYSFKDGEPNSVCNCGHHLQNHEKEGKYRRCLRTNRDGERCICRWYRWCGPYYAKKEADRG